MGLSLPNHRKRIVVYTTHEQHCTVLVLMTATWLFSSAASMKRPPAPVCSRRRLWYVWTFQRRVTRRAKGITIRCRGHRHSVVACDAQISSDTDRLLVTPGQVHREVLWRVLRWGAMGHGLPDLDGSSELGHHVWRLSTRTVWRNRTGTLSSCTESLFLTECLWSIQPNSAGQQANCIEPPMGRN